QKRPPTPNYLPVPDKHLRTHSELAHVEFIPLNDVNAFNLGNPLEGIADEGSIFIQSPETDPQRVWDHIPAYGQKLIRNKRLKVFYLDTVKIAKEIATEADL